jgi:predicted N-acetyltransferase YhbS
MALIIRHATGDDVYELARLAKHFSDSSPYAKYWDKDQLVSSLYRLLSLETVAMFVGEKDGHIVGAIAGMVANMWYNPNVPIVSELAWWVEVEHRGRVGPLLLRELEEWATEIGAVIISIGELPNMNSNVGKLLTRRGYEMLEVTYCKEL